MGWRGRGKVGIGIVILIGIVQFTLAKGVFPLKDDYLSQFNLSPSQLSKWLDLLHCRKGLFQYFSEVSDSRFFTLPDGGNKPIEELKRELEIFQKGGESALKLRCRFPLRYFWLKKWFPLPEIPISKCPKLFKALKAINPYKVSIVFADAYINKPAYMFGHTLLRIDDNRTNPLISTAVNYAAEENPTDGGLAFAFKGIFGFYKGYFTPMPYYDKIKQYVELEGRDLWEYRLNFTPAEAFQIALHTWELKDIYSPYYFFSRNCSYELLWLIQIVRPKLGIIDHFKGRSVIPIDTIRYLYSKGVIGGVYYRPSIYTQIQVISSRLPQHLKKLIKEVATGKILPQQISTDPNLTLEEKGRILDSGVRYLQYRANREGWSRKEYLNRFLPILRVRSKIPFIGNYRYPNPPRPDLGHNSHRFSAGWGVAKREHFYQIGIRGAYQSLEDIGYGFKMGSQVIFFEPQIRWYPERKKSYLHQLTLIDLKSVVPRDILFSPISWKVRFGIYRQPVEKGIFHSLLSLNPGGGFGYQIGGGYLYGLLQTQLDYSHRLKKNYRFGAGIGGGYLRWWSRYQLYLQLERLNHLGSYRSHIWRFKVTNTFKVGRNNEVTVTAGRTYFFEWSNSVGITFHHFFSW